MKRSTQSFAVGNTVYPEGLVVTDDNPLLKGRDALFVDFEPADDIETATAAPGQKRSSSRTKKAAAPKAD